MCERNLNTLLQLLFDTITTFLNSFVWPVYKVLYSYITEFRRLCTQPSTGVFFTASS